MLNDIELVSRFSPVLGEDYRQAKSYVNDVPTQTLLHIRSFIHKLTTQLAQPQQIHFDSPNLYDRIEYLNQRRVINVRTARALHRLRADGNKGAHPEKYHLTAEQLQQLSEKAIKNVLALVSSLYELVVKQPLPEYYFEDFDTLAGRDLCYRAVMEGHAESQYLVGMSLKNKALMQREQALALQDEPSLVTEDQVAATLQQASYWFAQASSRNANALFENGVAQIHGYDGRQDVAAGERKIAAAADAGVVSAMALLGYFYLVGSQSFEVDLTKAEHYLQQAGREDHAEAMANLGVLFYQQADLTQAYQYTARAAKAGWPQAQYNLALILASGEGCEPDIDMSHYWMNEAAEQGQLDAMLAVAQRLLNQDKVALAEAKRADRYLREVIKYGHSVPAMIERSIALADGVLGSVDVVASAALLALAKQHANDYELQVIEPLWDSLVQQIESVISVTDKEAELKSLTKAKELLSL